MAIKVQPQVDPPDYRVSRTLQEAYGASTVHNVVNNGDDEPLDFKKVIIIAVVVVLIIGTAPLVWL